MGLAMTAKRDNISYVSKKRGSSMRDKVDAETDDGDHKSKYYNA